MESGRGSQKPEAVRADIRNPAKRSSLPRIPFRDPVDSWKQGLEELGALSGSGGIPVTYLEPILRTLPPNHQHNQIGELLDHRAYPGMDDAFDVACLAQGAGNFIEEPHPGGAQGGRRTV
jgi:hypothetical protein